MPTTAGTGSAGTGAVTPYRVPTSGPVTPREIYALLTQKGLSTIQAIGVMGNMFAESHLDPESGGIDSNGYWAGGLISWNTEGYTNAKQLVTGNPQQDARAQIDYLFTSTSGLSAGLVGTTPQEVAGNFAANVEKCQGCQPGSNYPNGWAARRGFATMISGWQTSGNWPKAAGSAAGAPGAAGGGTGGGGSQCLLSVPLAGCILSTSKARALVGGLFVAAGLPVAVVGTVVLAAFAFRGRGIGKAAGSATEAVGGAVALIPGAEGAGAAIAAAGSVEKRAARRTQADRQAKKQASDQQKQARTESAQERHTERQYQRQPRARANYQRDQERDPAPF
jgi:hypothetical protein